MLRGERFSCRGEDNRPPSIETNDGSRYEIEFITNDVNKSDYLYNDRCARGGGCDSHLLHSMPMGFDRACTQGQIRPCKFQRSALHATALCNAGRVVGAYWIGVSMNQTFNAASSPAVGIFGIAIGFALLTLIGTGHLLADFLPFPGALLRRCHHTVFSRTASI